jgi:DNA-binding NarL/FixJ family response regulator
VRQRGPVGAGGVSRRSHPILVPTRLAYLFRMDPCFRLTRVAPLPEARAYPAALPVPSFAHGPDTFGPLARARIAGSPLFARPRPITVLLAEDHAILRQGLSALLQADGRVEVIGEARTGREAVEMSRALRPDVIVMDIAMPVLNGLEATRQILTENHAARVVILSAHSDDAYIERMTEAGVAGFLEKQTSAEMLAEAIQVIARGKTFFSPSIAKRLNPDHQPRDRAGILKPRAKRLTARECEVLQLVAEGSANKEVASTLGITVKTVEKHREHLMAKLDIHDTAGLTRYAIAAGVIESSVQLTTI